MATWAAMPHQILGFPVPHKYRPYPILVHTKTNVQHDSGASDCQPFEDRLEGPPGDLPCDEVWAGQCTAGGTIREVEEADTNTTIHN